MILRELRLSLEAADLRELRVRLSRRTCDARRCGALGELALCRFEAAAGGLRSGLRSREARLRVCDFRERSLILRARARKV